MYDDPNIKVADCFELEDGVLRLSFRRSLVDHEIDLLEHLRQIE